MAKRYLLPGTYSGSVAFTNTALWSSGTVPVTGDDVYMLQGNGLTFDQDVNQSAILLNSLTTGDGGPQLGGSGTNYFRIGATIQAHGVPSTDGRIGSGSGRLKIDSGTNATTVTVYKTASQGADTGIPAACFLGANTNNAISVLAGNVGLAATSPADAATWGTINNSGGTLAVGPGVTYSSYVGNGRSAAATLQAGGNTVTLTSVNGTVTTQGTFAIGTVTALGGTLYLGHRASSGTMVGTVNLNGGAIDMSANPATFSFGALAYTSGTLTLFDDGQQSLGTITLPFAGKTTKSLNNT